MSTESEVKPLNNLEELLLWNSKLNNSVTRETLRQCRHMVPKSPNKVLLCHDMKGGYLDDKSFHNSSNNDAYRFFFWSKIDVFIYFSHHFITIPPHCWISAAHRHEVKVFGTIITEWDDGFKLCSELLTNETHIDRVCHQLCLIANHYGFDGWLVNIENKIEPEKIQLLAYFVKQLKTEMAKLITYSEVIWYDSVIETGDLKWQDELNEKNRKFFDQCDGIFLNYNWNKEKLENSSILAGDRKQDVFVGVDVFGRGDHENAGFDCHKTVAKAVESGMSLAIFAHGWVYEVLGHENFTENEIKFWNLLDELLPSKPYTHLPLVSSFCQGFGKKMFRMGNLLHKNSWHCLSMQQLQPSFHACNTSKQSMTFCDSDAFIGGNCLRLKAELETEKKFHDFKIFQTNFKTFDISKQCLLSYCFKQTDANISNVGLVIKLETGDCVVCDQNSECLMKKNEISVTPATEAQIHKLGKWIERRGLNSWISRTYILNEKLIANKIITEISLRTVYLGEKDDVRDVNILLGEILLIPEKDLTSFTEHSSSYVQVKAKPIFEETDSCQYRLEWSCDTKQPTAIYDIRRENVDGVPEILGTTVQTFFDVNAVEKVSEGQVFSVSAYQCFM